MEIEIDKRVWYLRYFLLASTTFSLGARIIISAIEGPNPFHSFRAYTIQTNFLVFLWVILSILWKNDADRYNKLTGSVKGAITTYITITWIIFMILLEPIYDPVGINWWTSLFNHYLNPILFIFDFLISEKTKFEWRWPFMWLVFPIYYLVFALIWGAIYSEYLYFFLNLDELGVVGLSIWSILLLIIFSIIGLIFTLISRKYLAVDP